MWKRGEFDFVQLPAPGDRFTITEPTGSEDDMKVLYVEHFPVRAGEVGTPTATIIVEWLTGRTT